MIGTSVLNAALNSKESELLIIKAIALCFKPYLKPEEAMIYLNLGKTQLLKRCEEYGIYKNANGYFKREDLDLILSAGQTKFELAVQKKAS